MKRKKTNSTRTKKRINLFTTFFLLIIISLGTVFIAQQINQRQVINSNAAEVTCTTPGGCGGDCNPSQNNGCGYGGCRFWEYCADLNQDNIYSCYDTTALGTKEPDFNLACGQTKANITSPGSTNPTATPIPTRSAVIPPSSAPQTPSPLPPQNTICTKPEGCGGNCNPATNLGCGYGGCRFWEYCADENNDGVSSCYDTTALGTKEPDFNRACGYDRTSSSNQLPTSIPQVTSAPIPTTNLSSDPLPTNTPALTQTEPTQVQPTPPSSGAGNYDLSKLCIPVEINGSQDEKMDILIIPFGYTKEERTSEFYSISTEAIDTLKKTNLPEDIRKKINWYILNVDHPSYPTDLTPENVQPPANATPEQIDAINNALASDLLTYGRTADLCGRDRYAVIISDNLRTGKASPGGGFVVGDKSIPGERLVFAHEWGHAAGNLGDEYLIDGRSTYIPNYANCAPTGSNTTPNTDPCPMTHPGYGDTHTCNDSAQNEEYKKACPKWDCNVINCSAAAKQLLANSGCYPRCGSSDGFRAAANSIMSTLSHPDSNLFSGPSLVNIIENVFVNYK